MEHKPIKNCEYQPVFEHLILNRVYRQSLALKLFVELML